MITELGVGGAESMLFKLVTASSRTEFSHRVYALHGGGPFSERIEEEGIPVEVLAGSSRIAIPIAIGRLARSLRHFEPDILQTWLYRGDLAGLAVRQMRHGSVLIWNIRCAVLPGLGGVLPWLLASFSACPEVVVANSWSGRLAHEHLGYRPKKWVVLPNGFDLDRFRPDVDLGRRVRQELQIPEGAVVIGAVGRWDPVKGFDTLLSALEKLARRQRDLHVLFVGRGFAPGSPTFAHWVERLRPNVKVHCVGERQDPEIWFNAMDVFALPSRSEGFPNVLGEAMASGRCCVATDVGDVRHIVGDAGWIVPSEDPEQLAAALDHVCNLTPEKRDAFGRAARQRIERKFSLAGVVEGYEALYRCYAKDRHERQVPETSNPLPLGKSKENVRHRWFHRIRP